MSLVQGFETFKRLQITPSLVSKHTFTLSQYVYGQLSVLKHSNGQPLAELYHDFDYQSMKTQGGIVNFNLKRSNGDYVGYAEVRNESCVFKIRKTRISGVAYGKFT